MTRVLLLGLGEIGQFHLAALRSSPTVDLVGLCDLDADLLERTAQSGEWTSTNYTRVLEQEAFDAVDICLPHHLHKPLAIQALNSGRHVLLEKPMALNVAECDQIISAAEAHGVAVGVSHNQLFYKPHMQIRKMLDDGLLGDLRTIRARLAIGGRYGSWRSDPAQVGGGLLMDAGIHRIYLLCMLGGGVSSVLAFMDSPKHETSYTLIMEFASGAIGTIDATYCGPEGLFDDRVEVVGTDALVEAIGCEALFEGFASGPDLRVWRNGAWKYYETSDTWDASVTRSVSSFFDAVAREEQPPVDGNLGRQVLKIIEAAYISATEGRRVLL